MDYKEAIEELKSLKEHCFDMIDKEDKESIWIKDCEALSVAISAMQELQEQREIINKNKDYSEVQKWMQNIIDDAMVCLDEMKQDAKKNLNTHYIPLLYEGRNRKAKTVIYALIELNAYKQLGTLEEAREAVQRQQAKKPSPMLGIYGRVYECKECGNELEMYSKYCPFCGQKQEWE